MMIAQITGEGLTDSPARLHVQLTSHGWQAAVRVVRRRRLEAILRAEHGYSPEAAQVIAARLASAVSSDVIDNAARMYGEPELSPRAEPASAWRWRCGHAWRRPANRSAIAPGPARPTTAPQEGTGSRHLPWSPLWPPVSRAKGQMDT